MIHKSHVVSDYIYTNSLLKSKWIVMLSLMILKKKLLKKTFSFRDCALCIESFVMICSAIIGMWFTWKSDNLCIVNYTNYGNYNFISLFYAFIHSMVQFDIRYSLKPSTLVEINEFHAIYSVMSI